MHNACSAQCMVKYYMNIPVRGIYTVQYFVKYHANFINARPLRQIDPRAFHGMIALQELRLGHNHIKYLPLGLFNNSTSLKRLILYGNRIEILARGVFRGLTNLTSLFLQSNRLRLLQSGVFNDTPNLRKL